MNEQNKLHADGYFVFETESGIIGRTIATFTRAEHAAEYVKLKADCDRLRAALDKAIGAYHVIRSMAHDYAKAGGDGPEIRDWNQGERLILEASKALGVVS